MIWGKKEKYLYEKIDILVDSVLNLQNTVDALLFYHHMVGGTASCGSTFGVPNCCGKVTLADCEIKKTEVS